LVAAHQPTIPRSPDLTLSPPSCPTHFSMQPQSPRHSPSSTISSMEQDPDNQQPRSPRACTRSTHHCSAPSTNETPTTSPLLQHEREETCTVVTARAESSYHYLPEDADEVHDDDSHDGDTGLVYDDQGNLRLSAVRVGLAAGLGEMQGG
jgi:hypothetical protein